MGAASSESLLYEVARRMMAPSSTETGGAT
jgi:hypothetical protein